jgi:MFS family permease
VLSRSEAFFSVTGLVVPALGGLLAGPLGWRVAFVIGALAAGIGLLAIVFGTRSSSAALSVGQSLDSASPPAAGWVDLRSGGKVLLAAYLATFAVFYCRNGMLNSVLPVLGAERLNFAPFEIGLLYTVINALSIGAVLLGGRWADRFGRYRVLVPSLALLTVAQALLLVIHDPLTYIAVGLIQGLAAFINPLPTIVMGDALAPHLRARGIAVYRAVCDVAILSAPATMGMAIQAAGFTAAEAFNLTVCAVVLGGVWLLYASRSAPMRPGETAR